MIDHSAPKPESPAIHTARFHQVSRPKFSDVVAICALIVAIGSAAISYTQMSSVRHQLQLAELQVRPYVRFKPHFTEAADDDLAIVIRSENFSAIPAHVIYNETKFWVDRLTVSQFRFNRTGDILYQGKNGVMDVPAIPKKTANALLKGESELLAGLCIVYGSISPTDERRWLVKGVYAYIPHEDVPSIEYLDETVVSDTTERCSAVDAVSEWMAKREKPASDGSKGRDLPRQTRQ
jgi:hypothetical protein